MLAVLIFDHKCLSYNQIDTLMSEVLSWDLCDHLCKNLIIKLDYYEDFIFNWIAADHIYKKRASFVLIAASTIHDKSMTKETLDSYLKFVYENSCYEHDHIKKAVSWALREIGKTDFEYAENSSFDCLRFISQRKQSSNLDCQRCHKGIRNCRESKRTETLNYF